MWTNMTHYPYFVSRKETDFGVGDDSFNLYLNALREGDRAFGKIMRTLRERGIEESTLVVVLGDHGEAFGRHDQHVHASKIYEENVHIPLLFVNAVLFSGQERAVLGGLIDIAPTIMDILGLPAPDRWQGRSLFAEKRSPRVYFFCPWSDFLFGYRDSELKVIFNASRDAFEIYDLSNDPNETRNIADQVTGFRQEALHRLAALVQFQDRYMKELLHRTKHQKTQKANSVTYAQHGS
jgi:arylsulfatase A-like enzyme